MSKYVQKKTIGKMITISVTNNRCSVYAYYKGQVIKKWKQEEYGNAIIYHCCFDGNEWWTEKFASVCQEIWQEIDYNDADEAVEKMFKSLYAKSWYPIVIAFDISNAYHWKGRFKTIWTSDTDKIKIMVLC